MGLPVGPPVGGVPILPSPGQPGPMKPGEFIAGSIPQLTTFNLDKIAPPSALYIGRDDQLLIIGLTNTIGGDTLTVNIRMLTAVRPGAVGGQPDSTTPPLPNAPPLTAIEFGSQDLILVQNVVGTKLVPLAEGYLLSVACVSRQSLARGSSFVRAVLLRGGSTSLFAAQLLVSDYVTQNNAAGWPVGRVVAGRDGFGQLTGLGTANPAAGADFTFSIQPGMMVMIRSVQAQLVTSATAGTRIPQFQLKFIGSPAGTFTPNQGIPASTTAQVTGAGSSSPPVIAGDPNVVISLPSPLMIANFGAGGTITLNSLTIGLLAGDQWSNIELLGEVFTTIDG